MVEDFLLLTKSGGDNTAQDGPFIVGVSKVLHVASHASGGAVITLQDNNTQYLVSEDVAHIATLLQARRP